MITVSPSFAALMAVCTSLTLPEVAVTVLARASLSDNVASRIANNNHLIVLDIDEFLSTEPYSTGSLIHILLRNVKHIYCTGVQFLDRPLSNHINSYKTLTDSHKL